tara:strand:+ start:25675 stop:25908 length:234 start_codon:yes stop_codon:yes gene_type:complete
MTGEATQIGMLVAAVSVLSTVITVLWRQSVSNNTRVNGELEETRKLLNDCTEDRTLIWKTLAKQFGCPIEQLKDDNK